jgi:hypothetical protein
MTLRELMHALNNLGDGTMELQVIDGYLNPITGVNLDPGGTLGGPVVIILAEGGLVDLDMGGSQPLTAHG